MATEEPRCVTRVRSHSNNCLVLTIHITHSCIKLGTACSQRAHVAFRRVTPRCCRVQSPHLSARGDRFATRSPPSAPLQIARPCGVHA